MVREGRVFTSTVGKPAFGSGLMVSVLAPGAQVTQGSVSTTITVAAGHGFAAGDKYMIGTDLNTYSGSLSVLSVTATTLELEAIRPVASGDLIVNLGQDHGTDAPLYDGNGVTVYVDPDYQNAFSNGLVWADANGRYRYHHQGIQRWELVRAASGPIAIYQDDAVAPDTDVYANIVASAGSGAVLDPWTGWETAPAENVTVRFPNGNYRASSVVIIPEGCALVGNGYSSRIAFDRASDPDIGFVNATDAGNITMRNLYIDDGGASAQSANACIQFDTGAGQNYLFENLHIVDAAHTGIRVVGNGIPTNCRVKSCAVIGAQRHGIEFAYDVTYSSIEGCYVEDTNTVTLGAAIFAGSVDLTAPTRIPHHITVVGNTAKGCTDNGIRSSAEDYTVTGNTVDDCKDGIRLNGSRQTCSGNTVRDCREQGIKAENYESITISGNTVTGCTEAGIQVRYSSSQPSHITITGNTSSDNTLHGIHLRGGEDIVVSGNHCNDNGGANIWGEASDSTLLDRILISGNYCYKATSGLGNILVNHTGPVNGVVGVVNIVGNYCDGGGFASYGIGVGPIDPGTSVINIIDNVSINHAGDANLSLVVGCYLRHSGIGTGAFATSAAVKGSLWMQTDGTAGARDAIQVYDGSAWRYGFTTPTGGALEVVDGITAPGLTSGKAKIYVDTSDGDLKVVFGDGTIKTIVVDT